MRVGGGDLALSPITYGDGRTQLRTSWLMPVLVNYWPEINDR